MAYQDVQNPGIGGIDELTDAETAVVQQIAALGDPNADRILFWDDSAGSYAYLTVGSGLSITGTTITATAGSLDGSGTTNEIAYWVDSDTLGALAVATYPSLTELSYVKGVTSAIQTQLGAKASTALSNLASVAINTTLVSDTDNTDALGTSAIAWSDLFLGSGAVITFTSAPSTADVTLTHSANTLTLDGGDLALGSNNITMTGSLAATGARVTKGWFTDVESTNMPTVGGTSLTDTFVNVSGDTMSGLLTVSLAGNAVRFLNTTDGASVQVAKFEGDRATVADGDEAYISLIISDSGGNQDEGARITWKATTVTAGATQDTDLILSALVNNTLTTMLTLDGSANEIVPAVKINSAADITGAVITAATGFMPDANDGAYLGQSGTAFSDLFLASGGVIDFNGGASTITHSANTLTIGGSGATALALGTNNLTMTGSLAATGARVTKGWFTDIESTNMPTVGGTAILTSLTAPQFTTIELGHATQNTLSASGGVLSVEGVAVLTVAGGTLTGSITLGENTSIALDPAGSADGKYSGITIAGTAGAALAFGEVCYLAAADSRWELADADAATTADRMLGICVLAAAADGNATTMLLIGQIRADAKFPALTIGSAVYVGETAGAIQVAIPTGADNVIRRVGYALTADEIYFNPSMDSQISVA